MNVRTVKAMRYVMPLREGGSLPAIVEGDDDGLYVLKFRGAGQGVKALIAELVAGEIGRALGLKIPEIVFVELDARLARTEPDPEIQELIKASAGRNMALDYLPGSIAYDPAAPLAVLDAATAAKIVWFDALVTNVDRTPRNTNMLVWHRELFLIDHGASMYVHHDREWPASAAAKAPAPFPQIRDHVLLPLVSTAGLREADDSLSQRLTRAAVEEIVAGVPDVWLGGPDAAAASREAYVSYLSARLVARPFFADIEEAIDARA